MKRKYADRPNMTRIVQKTFNCMLIDEDSFQGYIGFLSLDKVREPLWVTYGATELCIADDGYEWLQYFPFNGGNVLTATYDHRGNLVQCYFDIVKKVGISTENIPYCDDLYLDIVALPNGEIYILDEDELMEALEKNEITKEEYDFAKSEADSLIQNIKHGTNYLINSTDKYYNFIKTIHQFDERRCAEDVPTNKRE